MLHYAGRHSIAIPNRNGVDDGAFETVGLRKFLDFRRLYVCLTGFSFPSLEEGIGERSEKSYCKLFIIDESLPYFSRKLYCLKSIFEDGSVKDGLL